LQTVRQGLDDLFAFEKLLFKDLGFGLGGFGSVNRFVGFNTQTNESLGMVSVKAL